MLSRGPRRLGALPAAHRRARPGEADRDAERRRRRAVRPGAGREPGCAAALGIAATTRWSRRSSRPSTAPITSSGSTSRSTALARARRRAASTWSSPAAASCSTASARRRRAAGVGERVHFLGAVPHAELPGVLRGGRPVPAHHRAAGVVRDRPDRGDGLRAAGDRDRLPGRAGRRRRGRDRPRWSRRGDAGRGRRGAPPSSIDAGAAGRAAHGSGRAREGGARCGAGRGCSTAWTAPTPRRSPSSPGRRPR